MHPFFDDATAFVKQQQQFVLASDGVIRPCDLGTTPLGRPHYSAVFVSIDRYVRLESPRGTQFSGNKMTMIDSASLAVSTIIGLKC